MRLPGPLSFHRVRIPIQCPSLFPLTLKKEPFGVKTLPICWTSRLTQDDLRTRWKHVLTYSTSFSISNHICILRHIPHSGPYRFICRPAKRAFLIYNYHIILIAPLYVLTLVITIHCFIKASSNELHRHRRLSLSSLDSQLLISLDRERELGGILYCMGLD